MVLQASTRATTRSRRWRWTRLPTSPRSATTPHPLDLSAGRPWATAWHTATWCRRRTWRCWCTRPTGLSCPVRRPRSRRRPRRTSPHSRRTRRPRGAAWRLKATSCSCGTKTLCEMRERETHQWCCRVAHQPIYQMMIFTCWISRGTRFSFWMSDYISFLSTCLVMRWKDFAFVAPNVVFLPHIWFVPISAHSVETFEFHIFLINVWYDNGAWVCLCTIHCFQTFLR